MTTFTGDEVSVFAMITLKGALSLYAKTGMKANRAYTPKNMRLTAEKWTGKKFGARDYAGMIAALDECIKRAKEARDAE